MASDDDSARGARGKSPAKRGTRRPLAAALSKFAAQAKSQHERLLATAKTRPEKKRLEREVAWFDGSARLARRLLRKPEDVRPEEAEIERLAVKLHRRFLADPSDTMALAVGDILAAVHHALADDDEASLSDAYAWARARLRAFGPSGPTEHYIPIESGDGRVASVTSLAGPYSSLVPEMESLLDLVRRWPDGPADLVRRWPKGPTIMWTFGRVGRLRESVPGLVVEGESPKAALAWHFDAAERLAARVEKLAASLPKGLTDAGVRSAAEALCEDTLRDELSLAGESADQIELRLRFLKARAQRV